MASSIPEQTPRIRVLCVIDSFGHEAGTENQLLEILRRIDRRRFEMHVACIEDSPRLRELGSIAKIRVFPATSVLSLNGIRQIAKLHSYIRTHGIHVVHTFMVRSNILGVLAAQGAGCRAVLASRRNLGYWYTPLYLSLFRLLNKMTTRIVANSEGAKSTVVAAEHVPARKVDVLYNGVDMDRFAAERGDAEFARSLGIPDKARVVGVVANLRPVKDLPLFLRAAALVAKAVPDSVFLLVGRGPLRDELVRLASELGIESRLFFSSDQGSVTDYLSRMSVACLSSHSEGFSNAILEYMATGLPVVATDVGGNREAIEHGVTGYVVSERSPESFAEPIIRLLTDEPLRLRMGRAGFERCQALFSITTAVKNHEQYYAGVSGAQTKP